jgi:hypothetical protein
MSSYSRLFGRWFPGHYEQALLELAERMKDIPENRRERRRGGELVVSGLVYLGQFIDHDLTLDKTELPKANTPPEHRTNLRRPFFDLDSVYGDGPRGAPYLYDDSTPDSERFLLGDTEPVDDIPSTPDDIPLRPNRLSAIADERNEENLIIAQLHVAFLQFHNRVLHHLAQARIPHAERYGSTPFQQAQRFVTWHYQWIVGNEFLPRMVLDDVLTDILANGPKLFNPRLGDDIALPVEFTHAAFRFGHSMVQNAYRLRQERVVKLKDLVKQTAPNEPRQKLKATDVLDWYFFLTKSGQLPNFADNIDTLIAEGMYELPHAAIALFSATPAMPLPAITLLRGSRIGLPSGQEACELSGVQPLSEPDIAFDEETRSFLERNGMLKRTPLWYYILREAEVFGAKNEQRRQKHLGGECLGPLGSRIVAEVLLGVMNSDRAHYLNAAPKWEPPHLVFGESRQPRQIGHLRELISFAKSDLVTPNTQMFWRA